MSHTQTEAHTHTHTHTISVLHKDLVLFHVEDGVGFILGMCHSPLAQWSHTEGGGVLLARMKCLVERTNI